LFRRRTNCPGRNQRAPEGPGKSQDWWSATPPTTDWAQPAANDETAADDVSKESTTADVYFCGQTSFFPLNRALQAIVKEKLSGSLRLFWDQEPIDLLTQNGEIVFATTRDLELYCPESPAALANVDAEIVAKARRTVRNGTPLSSRWPAQKQSRAQLLWNWRSIMVKNSFAGLAGTAGLVDVREKRGITEWR
jgi:hypothetical protein